MTACAVASLSPTEAGNADAEGKNRKEEERETDGHFSASKAGNVRIRKRSGERREERDVLKRRSPVSAIPGKLFPFYGKTTAFP